MTAWGAGQPRCPERWEKKRGGPEADLLHHTLPLGVRSVRGGENGGVKSLPCGWIVATERLCSLLVGLRV